MSDLLRALRSAFILGWRAGYGKDARKRGIYRAQGRAWWWRLRWGWMLFKCPLILWWVNGRKFGTQIVEDNE